MMSFQFPAPKFIWGYISENFNPVFIAANGRLKFLLNIFIEHDGCYSQIPWVLEQLRRSSWKAIFCVSVKLDNFSPIRCPAAFPTCLLSYRQKGNAVPEGNHKK